MTTREVRAFNKGSGHSLPTNEAGARAPEAAAAAPMSPEAYRQFILEAFRKAGKPAPAVLDQQALVQAQFLAEGKPIPAWARLAETPATQCATPEGTLGLSDLKTLVDGLEDVVIQLAQKAGLEVVRDDAARDVQQFAVPTSPWDRPVGSPVIPERRDGEQEFAAPTAWHVEDKFPEDTKSPDGNPKGDPKIIRRRRALKLERQIMDAKKRLKAAAPADRARIDAELLQWSSELEAIREAEREGRDQYKKF
jgi:hypothetical protein